MRLFADNRQRDEANLTPNTQPADLLDLAEEEYGHSEYGLGKWHKMAAWASIPALLVSGLLTVFVSMATGRYVYTFMLETNPLVVLASAGIFAFFMCKAGREREVVS